MARVLITGGCGFLGSHLCDRLIEDGHRVTALDSLWTGRRENVQHLYGYPAFELIVHDVRVPLSLAGYDQVYHLASPASPVAYQSDPVKTLMTNVVGTEAMLTLAKRDQARFLLASTSEVYGDPLEHPQREDYVGNVNPIGPRACYDEGKRASETLCHDFSDHYGVDVRVARIFNTYGPRLSAGDGRVVSNFIVQALAGKPLTIYGDGCQTRSFCYVDDMVDGLVRLMNAEKPLIPVNLGNPEEITVLELAWKIGAILDKEIVLDHKPYPEDDPARRRPDISRAIAELGWQPTTSLLEGLEKTIDYFVTLDKNTTAVA
jgi:UDP-glucuronate decarboxylase